MLPVFGRIKTNSLDALILNCDAFIGLYEVKCRVVLQNGLNTTRIVESFKIFIKV
jgi:hypothetical protein